MERSRPDDVPPGRLLTRRAILVVLRKPFGPYRRTESSTRKSLKTSKLRARRFQGMTIRSVQIWTCPCGISYRAVSELENPALGSTTANPKTSPFECPTCHRIISLDGTHVQVSF